MATKAKKQCNVTPCITPPTRRSTPFPSVTGRCAIKPRSAGHLYVRTVRRLSFVCAITCLIATPLGVCAQEVSLKILPDRYLVNEKAFAALPDAIDAALSSKPTELSLEACMAMPTQRVVYVMAALRGRFDGRLKMKSIHSEKPGCPEFSEQPSSHSTDNSGEFKRLR